jgi:outer membrane protein OmpA-like peptidoglycan-associated protein
MFIVQGTASQTGASSFDFRLSQQRALAMRSYIEQKLQRSLANLFVEALGKDNPTANYLSDRPN